MAIFNISSSTRGGNTIHLGTVDAETTEKAKETAMARALQYNLWQFSTFNQTPPPGMTTVPRPVWEIISISCSCNQSVVVPQNDITAAVDAARALQAPIT